jgi:2-amino-4-hydroxy-6-hydroxymethyldihydropteridine diphosphokinase
MSSALSMNHRAIVAFGANLGDREGTIRAALEELDGLPGVRLVATSPLYTSDPVGYADQPEFLNGAAAFDTAVDPEVFLKVLLHTEKNFGRVRDIPNGPRTLDLDLIFYDGTDPHNGPGLILPHPRWRERSFVTVPVADLLASPEFANDSRWDELRLELKSLTNRAGLRRV